MSSKVILVKHVTQDMDESDLRQLLQPFGKITKFVMHSSNQALLQMEDMHASESAMKYYSLVQPNIRGKHVQMQFFYKQDITGQSSIRTSHTRVSSAKRILSVTIRYLIYPIKVDVLNEVFKNYGSVEKIVTIEEKSDGMRALIQYQSPREAEKACRALHGKNIYDGCCQLDIRVSSEAELHVHYNNDQSWDYTNPTLPTAPRPSQAGRAAIIAIAFGGALPPGVTGTNEWSTLIVHNLNCDKIDEDKLFNLFSMYGRIVRIKISSDKPTHAFIEMADGLQAELATHYLEGALMFGKKLEVNYSKELNITLSGETKDCENSKKQRFKGNNITQYRHLCPPTSMLHISYLPETISEDAIEEYFCEHGVIREMKLYEVNGRQNALVLFSSAQEATEALVSKCYTHLGGSLILISFTWSTI